MYAVFEKNLLTDKGKALVRAHQKTYNAQLIYKELQDYALMSTNATMGASSLLSYVTTSNLGDGKWKGTNHAYILHWQDQVRKYHDLNPSQVLSNDILRTLLENAVHPVAELRAVKVQAAQHRTHTGKDLTYEQYCSLLLSAAQQHDQGLSMMPSKAPKRQIYAHEASDRANIDGELYMDTQAYDIDHPIQTLDVNNTAYSKPRQRLSPHQWRQLSDQARKVWDILSPKEKQIILERPPPEPDPGRATPIEPVQQVNEHDISYISACLHQLYTDSHLEAGTKEDEQPLLAHITKRKPLPPGDIKRLFSPSHNNKTVTKDDGNHPKELNVDGIIYRQVGSEHGEANQAKLRSSSTAPKFKN